MNGLDAWTSVAELVVTLGLSTIRLAVAFLMLPIFTNEMVPALVRNSIFAALALVIAMTQPMDTLLTAPANVWFLIISKEVFLGLALGIFFGLFLWAFSAAGEIIDSQIGTSQAQIFDPVSGHEVTVFGEFLTRFAGYVFVAAGGLSLFSASVLKSFSIWRLAEPLPNLQRAGVILFSDTFSAVFTLAVMLAAPLLTVLFVIDMAMGLVNRFAERLNVFFLSNSIKSLIAVILVLLMLALLAERLLLLVESGAGDVQAMIQALFVQ